MKKLLFALLLLGTGLPTAWGQAAPSTEQSAPNTAFADAINAVFQNVDKNRIPSGILEEYGLQFINHVPYTGTTGYTAQNQLDINRCRALYGDLDEARINYNAAGVPSLAAVNVALSRYEADAYVELPILHLNYHSIRTEALSAGLIRSVNNQLSDVPGRDPYQLNSAFAVAASRASLPSATPRFVFRPDLFWTNTGRTVATIQVDFADGNGFVPMRWSVIRAVNYASAVSGMSRGWPGICLSGRVAATEPRFSTRRTTLPGCPASVLRWPQS